MGLNIGEFLGGFETGKFYKFFGNPLYVAIIIVLLATVFVIFMFREDIENFWPRLGRFAIYFSIPIAAAMFLYYKSVEREFNEKSTHKSWEHTVVSAIGHDMPPPQIQGKGETSAPLISNGVNELDLTPPQQSQ